MQTSPERRLPHQRPARRVAAESGPRVWNPWAFLIGALLLGSGVLLGVLVDRINPRSSGEYAVLQWLYEARSPVLDWVTHALEVVGGPLVVPWALLVTGLVLFLARRRVMALVAWLMPALGWYPGHLAKKTFPRERPGDELEPVVVYQDVMSFPSGHTGFATSISIFVLFALTMWGLRRAWMVVAAIVVIVVMAVSRLYAAAHFPLDVVGGSILAAGASLMLWPAAALAWTRAQARGGFWAEPAVAARRGRELPGPAAAGEEPPRPTLEQ